MLAALFLLTILAGLFPVAAPMSNRPVLSAATFSLPGLASSAPVGSVNSIGSAPVPLTRVAPAVRQEAVAPSPSIEVARAAISNATGSTSINREQGQVPIFYRYEVKEGDSVSSIARKYGVARDYILWNNIEIIDDENLLKPGQLLQIPSVEGVIHSVRLGETLTEIASHYDAKVEDIIAFPANNLANPNDLRENGMILVPGGRIIPKPAPTLRPESPALVTTSSNPAPAAAGAPAPPAASAGWAWPVAGAITSQFGPSHPLGIDINAPYVPVAAAAAGQVVFVGGDRCCSYGWYIEIQHPGGYSTRYAHLSEFTVTLGQVVSQGQRIGTSGSTGNSTGPHLHFEMRRNGQIVNPMSFLP